MSSKTRNPLTTETTEPEATQRSRSASANRVILVGRLVADPILRTTASGLSVTTIRIATNDREQPEFHDVVLWRQQAEFACQYMAQGPPR
jgi:single stranded DNA-binding protein